MKKNILLSIFFYLITLGCIDNSKKISSPKLIKGFAEKEGVSEEKLLRIDEYINKSISKSIIPGAVALVTRNGKIIYHKAFGYENFSEKIPFEKNHIFRIASMTKAITSLAVLILWEEGKFSLDDPIEKFIPEFKDHQILEKFNKRDSTYTTKNAKNKITIRNLLTHSSGMGYGFIDSDPAIKSIFTKNNKEFMKNGVMCFCDEDVKIENIIKNVAKYPLHHEPGEKWTYSVGLDVLGYFIELQSGLSLSDFFQTRIFDPLGMTDTQFYLNGNKENRLVSVQTIEDGKWVDFEDERFNVNYPIRGSKTTFFGGCGLTSTVEDYAKFMLMILNKGKYNNKQIIATKTHEAIVTGQGYFSSWGGVESSLAFSLSNSRQYFEKGTRGSEGALDTGGYWNTSCIADPKENIIAILYKQTYDLESDPTSSEFRRLVFQSIVD
tara:strand:+ start:147 stop:1457 length:1311 start_codon:yes stop_codon:yes gene_type:complete